MPAAQPAPAWPSILIAPRSAPSRLSLACAASAAAVVAWLSQGSLALTGSSPERVALLPLAPSAILLSLAAGLAVAWVLSRAGRLTPLLLLAFLVLPWLPLALPPVAGFWSQSLGLLIWVAVIAAAAVSPRRALDALPPSPLAAGAVACVIFSAAAWQVAPSVPGGDEPHYLVITQSLLYDGDLEIGNNHTRGDYLAYYNGPLNPDFRVRGRDGGIYSIHAPGVSALVAPAFAIGGYRGVVVFLVLLAAAGSALAWHLAHAATGRADAAWLGWAAVTLATTTVFHSFTVYPDGPGGVIALTGVWALLRASHEAPTNATRMTPWFLHGAALATLPWLHTRFALLAGGFGALILWRLATTRNAAGKAVAFLSIPAVSALAWMFYFVAIYGTPDPSAPYGGEAGSFAHVPGGFVGLMVDQRFGLLAYAPVLAVAFGGLWVMVRSRDHRRLGLEYLFVLIPYVLVITHFAMWWGGHSAPARFLVPVLPMLTIPAAAGWLAVRERATRATMWAALAFTAVATAVLMLVDGGRLAYNTREAYALWLEWLNPSLDLGRALPAFWRGREEEMYRDAAIWCVALAAAWGTLRAAQDAAWARPRVVFATLAGGIFALAAMIAVPVVWRVNGSDGTTPTPGQLEILRRLGAEPRVLAFDPDGFRRLDRAQVGTRLRLQPARSTEPGGAGRDDRPLFVLPNVPAGRYRLTLQGGGPGWVMLGIGRDQFALRTEQVGAAPGPLVVDLPVAVRALIVRGDEALRRNVRGLTMEPLSVVPPGDRLTGAVARRAVRYEGGSVFFLDEASYAEPEAFWIAGRSTASIVIQPDAPSRAILRLRNAPVPNDVQLAAGAWRETLSLGPGEERTVSVPVAAERGAVLLTVSSAAGFRPSEVEPGSRDNRFLGVWVQVGR
jgi:hypothetical protein